MATEGNNFSAEFAHIRDSFFTESEIEQFNKVMENPIDQFVHQHLSKQRAWGLYSKAMNIIQKVEYGEYEDNEMPEVERLLSHYLAAIQDIIMEMEKERTEINNDVLER